MLHIDARHILPGQVVYMVPDPRGESESYEAYSLECRALDGRLVWTEGIRRDRETMFASYREAINAALLTMWGE